MLKIMQMGGYRGSFAGDCCIVQWGSGDKTENFGLIDLGLNNLCFPTYKEIEGKLKFVVLTHMHKDHISNQTNWQWAVQKTENLILPKWTTDTKQRDAIIAFVNKQKKSKIVIKEVEKDTGEIFKLTRTDTGNCEVSFVAIVPDKDKKSANADENEASIGLLIKLKHGKYKWNMLTLGDMERKTARDSIEKVLSDKTSVPKVDVCKLPHHGSSNNRMNIIDDEILLKMISDKTTVVSSGYTDQTLNLLNATYYNEQLEENEMFKYYMLLTSKHKDFDSIFGHEASGGWKTYVRQLRAVGASDLAVLKYVEWEYIDGEVKENKGPELYDTPSLGSSRRNKRKGKDDEASSTTAPSTSETPLTKGKDEAESEAASSTADATADTSIKPNTKAKRSLDSEVPSSTASTTADTSNKPANKGRVLSKGDTDEDDDVVTPVEREVKKSRKSSSSPGKKSAMPDKSSVISGTDDDDGDDNSDGKEKKNKKRKK